MKRLLCFSLAIMLIAGLISCQVPPREEESQATKKAQALAQAVQKTVLEFAQLNDLAIKYLVAENYDKALETFAYLLKKHPRNVIVMYNIACAFSLKGDKEKACEYLHRAVQFGYMNWKNIEADEDLTNIREEEDYKKLIESLKTLYPDIKEHHFHLKVVPPAAKGPQPKPKAPEEKKAPEPKEEAKTPEPEEEGKE